MTTRRIPLLILVLLTTAGLLQSQVGQTGSLRGTVSDPDGIALPGVTVTVTSPALMGERNLITNDKGIFRLPGLFPGTYEVRAELTGFQTVIRRNIIIRVGQTIDVAIEMPQADISEEIEVTAASPVVDTVATKIVANITSDTLQQVPLSRNVYSAIQVAPGVVERTIHGSARNDASYNIDGVTTNAPDQNYGEAQVPWDMIEEVELITGGATAEAFNAIGGVINVVTKSGGNDFHGSAQFYYTSEDLAEVLLPDEELNDLGVGKPSFAREDTDLSASLGGPIIRDKIWFLGNFRLMDLSRYGTFRPTTILGQRYDSYDWVHDQYFGFGKLSFQITDSLRAFTMLSYHYQSRPNITNNWYTTLEANTHHTTNAYTGTGQLAWTLDSNTFVDTRFGFWYFNYDGKHSAEENTGLPAYRDAFTSYRWNSKGMNDFTRKRVYQASVKITRFQDDFLGGDHELKAGIEYDLSSGGWGFWQPNPLSVTFYDGNIYYWRGLNGVDVQDPVHGDGRVAFSTIGPDLEDTQAALGKKRRFGFFLQDSFTIQRRLTINLGLRYDTIKAWMPELTKFGVTDPVALAVGESYFRPEYGFNPYQEISYPKWDDAFPYEFLSPTVGINFDVFGNGRTAFKASYGKYAEGLPTWYFDEAHPISPTSFSFDWFDNNGNQVPDAPGTDEYVWLGGNVIGMRDTSGFDTLIDPDIKIPFVHEYHAAIEHELFNDFKVSVSYTRKDRRNLFSDPLYDLETGTYWNTADSRYWIPFNTTIPATGDFPAVPVTMYFISADHPDEYYRHANVEAEANYESVEFGFNKRMSRGWQLGGSVILSRNEGDYPLGGGWAGGKFRDPNYAINSYGDQAYSRPLAVKLFGSFTLPYNVIMSFFYTHISGSPWTRTITVVPPSDWAAANNALTWSYGVNVEAPGTYRNASTDNCDFRVEKEVLLGKYGKIGIFADIFNLFGNTDLQFSQNPGGTWRPDGEGTISGSYAPGWTGVTGISATRVFKFSIRYSF